MGLQEVFPGVAMEASLTEVLAMVILGLIPQEVVEVLDPFIAKIFCLFKQQEVAPGHIHMLLGEPANHHTVVLPKYIER